jgi:hypothetical protein
MNRPPQTLHEHYLANNLGCTSYQQFCRMKEAFDNLETFLKKWHSETKEK